MVDAVAAADLLLERGGQAVPLLLGKVIRHSDFRLHQPVEGDDGAETVSNKVVAVEPPAFYGRGRIHQLANHPSSDRDPRLLAERLKAVIGTRKPVLIELHVTEIVIDD